ncbi:MAG: type II CAAX endopeptidase family protein [Lachnospiraceae bacterium]|nr:type II CAAX endopeptidase family protein [Lachnospiraceae bacterium]
MEDTRKFWTKERGASLFLLVIILIFIGNSLFNRISNQILSLLVTQLLILVPAIIYMLILKVNPFQFIRFRRFHLGSAFLIPLLVICLVPVISLVNAFTMLFTTPTIGNAVSDIVSGNLGIGLLFVAVLPGFVEEITFRGAIYHSVRGARPVRAILLSALMFGAMHMNFNQFCYATILGLVLGLVLEATGSIVATMLLHMCFNANSVVLSYGLTKLMNYMSRMGVPGYEDALNQAASQQMSPSDALAAMAVLLPVAAVGLVLAAILYYCIAKLNKRWYYICFLFSKNTKDQRDTYEKPQIVYVPTIACFVLCFGMCILQELVARGIIHL